MTTLSDVGRANSAKHHRRGAVTLYFNLHWNSQILVNGSQGLSNLTSFHHCAELRFPNAQGCQALKCGPRFHDVITSLSHQSRRTLPRDWVASVAVHEDSDLVSMILSSKSQRRFGFHNEISRCAFQWDKVEFTKARSFSGPNSWAKYECLHAYLGAFSFFRIGLRLPSHTNLSCSFSHDVLTVFVFALHLIH